MKSRVAAGIVAGMLAVALAGCAGSAAPKSSPTPTPPFASADAAYKAAEATYKAYVDAGNRVNLAEPKTFEPLYALLLGDALDTDREELTAMSSKGWTMSGSSSVASAQPLKTAETDPQWGDVSLAACLDVHDVRIEDRTGNSVVSAERPDVQALKVDLVRDHSTKTGLKIVGLNKRTGAPKCAA